MAKSPLDRYGVWGIVFFVAILIGIGLLPSLFFQTYLLGFIGIFLLIFSAVGIIVIRKKVSALKRANPELFKALEAENNTSATKCAVCGAEGAFLFRCYYCREHFCEEHKLSENHHCSMAPSASFRTVIWTSTLLVFVGIAILYVYLMQSLIWGLALGGFLVGMGLLFLIGRAWEEKQSRRAMGLS